MSVVIMTGEEVFVKQCLEEVGRRGGREEEGEVRRRCGVRWGQATVEERRWFLILAKVDRKRKRMEDLEGDVIDVEVEESNEERSTAKSVKLDDLISRKENVKDDTISKGTLVSIKEGYKSKIYSTPKDKEAKPTTEKTKSWMDKLDEATLVKSLKTDDHHGLGAMRRMENTRDEQKRLEDVERNKIVEKERQERHSQAKKIREHLQQDKLQREKINQDKVQREKLEKEKFDKLRLEREKLKKLQREKEMLLRMQREKLEKERSVKEKVFKDKLETSLGKDSGGKKTLDRERSEKEKVSKEKSETGTVKDTGGKRSLPPFYWFCEAERGRINRQNPDMKVKITSFRHCPFLSTILDRVPGPPDRRRDEAAVPGVGRHDCTAQGQVGTSCFCPLLLFTPVHCCCPVT